MRDEYKKALIGFYSFSGNDYVSSFFRKSKIHCWKVLGKNSRSVRAFARLGKSQNLEDEIMSLLEEFVCNIYRKKLKSINVTHYRIFETTYEKK